MKEFIEILYLLFGVEKEAGVNELKKAYRKIATQFHPDKDKDIDPNIFIALSKGYEILLEEIKKKSPPKEPMKKKGPPVNLTDEDINYIAIKKISNTFKTILNQEPNDILLNFDILSHMESLFNDEIKLLNHTNAEIRIKKNTLIKFKKRIKCEKDSVSLHKVVDNLIEEKVQLIKENKNKIKINNLVCEMLKHYSFEKLFEDSLTDSFLE